MKKKEGGVFAVRGVFEEGDHFSLTHTGKGERSETIFGSFSKKENTKTNQVWGNEPGGLK